QHAAPPPRPRPWRPPPSISLCDREIRALGQRLTGAVPPLRKPPPTRARVAPPSTARHPRDPCWWNTSHVERSPDRPVSVYHRVGRPAGQRPADGLGPPSTLDGRGRRRWRPGLAPLPRGGGPLQVADPTGPGHRHRGRRRRQPLRARQVHVPGHHLDRNGQPGERSRPDPDPRTAPVVLLAGAAEVLRGPGPGRARDALVSPSIVTRCGSRAQEFLREGAVPA